MDQPSSIAPHRPDLVARYPPPSIRLDHPGRPAADGSLALRFQRPPAQLPRCLIAHDSPSSYLDGARHSSHHVARPRPVTVTDAGSERPGVGLNATRARLSPLLTPRCLWTTRLDVSPVHGRFASLRPQNTHRYPHLTCGPFDQGFPCLGRRRAPPSGRRAGSRRGQLRTLTGSFPPANHPAPLAIPHTSPRHP